MAELTNAGSPANEVSLRDVIAAEYEKASTPETPVATGAPPPAPAAQETEAEAAERARDERGRFAAKAADAPETAAKAAPDTNAAAPADKAAIEGGKEREASAKTVAAPPPGWSVAAKSEFDSLPDAVKAAVAKREEEIDRGFAKLKDFKAIESQHTAAAQQYGVPLTEYINNLAAADKFLQAEPLKAIRWLADTYRIDLSQLGAPAAQQQQAAARPENAAVQPLLQEINALKEIVYGDKRNQINNQVEQFFADPKNKYSENVADQMVVLINEAKRAGQPVDLPSIYETACFMNPEVRAALIKEQTGKLQADQAAKAKQTADQARAAGASITGGPAATPPPIAPNLDLRATLEQNFAALAGRT
jgi:hypothetical protein